MTAEKAVLATNWKMVDGDGGTFIKVISFPVPEGSPVAEESMWVKQVSGTDNNGIGTLDNKPYFCTAVTLGDLVRYGGGTSETKPRFVEKVEAEV